MRLGEIETGKLESDSAAVLAYYRENLEYLRPFEPAKPAAFLTGEYWRERLRQNMGEFHTGQSMRLFLFPKDRPGEVIGTANFTGIIRGAFHACFLGYSLAEREQGKGFMTEALSAAIRYAFEDLGLHRVSANYMPRNERSGRLLERLGFVVEGRAKDYLLINGRWEDHVLTSLVNQEWQP